MGTIEIVVERDGSQKMEAKNFTGRDCEAATRKLEELLGMDATTREWKPEADVEQHVPQGAA